MKKIAIIIALCCLRQMGMAQLYNNGSTLQVNTSCVIQVNGNFTNTATSTHTNNGIINVTGNCTNNQVMATPNNGTLVFTGTAAQTINGSATYFTKDVLINNAAGIHLIQHLK